MTPIKISATEAKLGFGTFMARVKAGNPIIVEKNETPEMVWISIDDYEDFLEIRDTRFQKTIADSKREMGKGTSANLSKVYAIHRKTIETEGKKL